MSTAHVGWAVGGGLMAVAIAAATTWSAGAHPAPGMHTAASPATASVTDTSPAAASSSAPSSTASAASAAQAAQANAELTALAQQLPADVRLTAPAAWKTWTGSRPLHAHDVDGCPHVSDRLGAALGGHWRYAQGTLPSGPVGCSWTSAAGPDVGIGYEHGSLPGAATGEGSCVGVTSVAVSAVHAGAVLIGCDGATGSSLTLAVPDSAGTGVFLLHADGGPAVTRTQESDALLGVLSAARHAYAG